jgi:hypothetical protein
MGTTKGDNSMSETNGLPPYIWKVEFKDGTSLVEYNDDGTKNKLDIDRLLSEAKKLWWLPTSKEEKKQPYFKVVLEGDKPIIARRRVMPMDFGRSDELIVYIIGTERANIDGEMDKDIVYFSEPFSVKITWPGSQERSTEKKFRSSFETWITQNCAMFKE